MKKIEEKIEERIKSKRIIDEIKLVEKNEGIIYSDNFIDRLRELSDECLLRIAFELSLVNIPFSKTDKRQINAYGISDLTQIDINGNIVNISSSSNKNKKVVDVLVIAHKDEERKKLIKEYEQMKELSVSSFEYRVVVVNNLDDYYKFVHGMSVRDIVFADISKVTQEMYDILRTRIVR